VRFEKNFVFMEIAYGSGISSEFGISETPPCDTLFSVYRADFAFFFSTYIWTYLASLIYRIFSNLIRTSFCRFLKQKKS
jgi:hypothetical protein